MFTVCVKGVGHGTGYNSYPVEFEFTMNGKPEDWEDEDGNEINRRAVRKLKDKTCCDCVTVKEITVKE